MITASRAAVRSLDVFHRAVIEHMEERGLISIIDEKPDKKRQGASE